MELGNYLFGHSRGRWPVERDEEAQEMFYKLFDAYNNGNAYGYAKEGDVHATELGGYENDTFCVNPYYWGDDDELAQAPNFFYKPSRFELRWYKYPLRDSYSNVPCTPKEIMAMLTDCIESVMHDNEGGFIE